MDYPLQIGDTYALQVNYSGKLNPNGKYNDDVQDIDDKPFLHLKQEILEKIAHQTGSIGQTWVLSAKLTTSKTDSDIEKIAQKCYSQIITNYNWQRDLIGKGTLLGGSLFQLWYRPENTGLTGKEFWDKFRQESYHVLIWLFPENQTPEEMRDNLQILYYDFLRLFQYRHKIIWAYYQSRYHKLLLKKEYIDIQPAIQGIRQLTESGKTTRVNLTQLQKTLNDHQVVSDCQNFQPGLTLLENLNSTIQGIIDLEQTKSDRALDDTIAIAGIGLSISGLTATAISIQQPPPNSYTNFSFLTSPVFVLSLLPSAPFLIILLYRLLISRNKINH